MMSEEGGYNPVILVDLNKPWEKVLSLGVPMTFASKSVLSAPSPAEAAGGIYYIRSGKVRLSNISVTGQETVMLYMGRGTLFNEVPTLHVADDYLFTSMERTEAVFFSKKIIGTDFIRTYPELIFNLLESMTKKARSFFSQLYSLRMYDAFVNVCRTLYSMYLFNRTDAGVIPRLTQQELSAFLGVHRSSLHKALSRLKDEGIIGRYSRGHLDVYQPERLLAYAAGRSL